MNSQQSERIAAALEAIVRQLAVLNRALGTLGDCVGSYSYSYFDNDSDRLAKKAEVK